MLVRNRWHGLKQGAFMQRSFMRLLIAVLLISFGLIPKSVSAQSQRVCGGAKPGYARCHAIVTRGEVSTGPRGYGPADFRAAYSVGGSGASHVGVVVAYDAPTLLTDVNTFSRTYGLPGLAACSSHAQIECLSKVSQSGGNSLPPANSNWAVEASLDVESVHGMCPHCRITLVEARTSSITNLSTAAETAARLGADFVSNSYGGSELGVETTYDERYHKPGVTVIASSGDSGYGTSYPAASPYVIAVGGTSLRMQGGTVISETAWSGAGSGCSSYEPKPAWQHDVRCLSRSIADVAADADPSTGAAIYDSYPSNGHSGWLNVGGTSLAAPLVTGILASSQQRSYPLLSLYSGMKTRDIISGANGTCAGYPCHALSGYDGPTGVGVLNRW